jgi:hypothetical protein
MCLTISCFSSLSALVVARLSTSLPDKQKIKRKKTRARRGEETETSEMEKDNKFIAFDRNLLLFPLFLQLSLF